MYLTDNLGNKYMAYQWGGDAAQDVREEIGKTYYGTFTFHSPKPGAVNFTFHDEDTSNVITDIVFTTPSVYIYDIQLAGYPLAISYYSDKWKEDTTDQGAVRLTHLKYANCEIMENQPGAARGSLINSIDIGDLSYDLYRTQQPDYSQREYVLTGGLQNVELPEPVVFVVHIPYDTSSPCIDDVSTILGSVHPAEP